MEYAEAGEGEMARPTLECGRDVQRVKGYVGKVWCVTVPTGLIVVQRAVEEEGEVVSASQPVIVGNCDLKPENSQQPLTTHWSPACLGMKSLTRMSVCCCSSAEGAVDAQHQAHRLRQP